MSPSAEQLVKKVAAELIGTFAMVFAGCGAIMVAERFPGALPPGSVPVVFGLIVAAMIYSVGHISGAHFNPAVSLAFAIGRHFPTRELFWYWAAQFGGAILASIALWILLPPGVSFGAAAPLIDPWRAVAWEGVLTYILMFVIVSVATDARAVGVMAGAAIGAAVTLAALFGGPVTGAAMNPARALAPALFEGKIDTLWIYFVGPTIGAVLAALTYNLIRCHEPDAEPKPAKGCC